MRQTEDAKEKYVKAQKVMQDKTQVYIANLMCSSFFP